MQLPLVVLAEPDPSLRELMRRTLAGAGFEVLEGGSLSHLEVHLRLGSVLRSEALLLVLGVRLAVGAAPSIRAVARERARQLQRAADVILTYEFGTLTTIPAPEVAPCRVAAIFEKPFDLQTLQSVASACSHESDMELPELNRAAQPGAVILR